MRIIQNDGEEIQVLLDYNEALDLLRIAHKKYAANERAKERYVRWITTYAAMFVSSRERYNKKITKSSEIMSNYSKYERVYQLLYKNRRKKTDEQG